MPDEMADQEQFKQDLARIEKTQEALRYYLGANHPDVVELDREIAEAVEEKPCETCGGRGFVLLAHVRYHHPVDCPTCRGMSKARTAGAGGE